MDWLARNNLLPTDALQANMLNSLANDDRNWGGDVNGGGHRLSNVILDGSGGFQFYTSPVTITPGPDGGAYTQYDQTVGPNNIVRWIAGKNFAAEGSGNAGSDYEIRRYDDAGALLGTPFAIRRSDGLITMGAQHWTGPIDGGGQTLSNITIAGMVTNPMTAKGDLIAGGAAGAPTKLGVGTNGQTLVADSAVAGIGLKWATTDPTTTLGDLIVRGPAAVVRLPRGADGQVLVADSAVAGFGLKWATAGGSATYLLDGVIKGTRPNLNVHTGANAALTMVDDPGNNQVILTIAGTGGGGGGGPQTPWISDIDGGGFALHNTSNITVTDGSAGFPPLAAATRVFVESNADGSYYESASSAASIPTGYLFSSGASLTSYIIDLNSIWNFVSAARPAVFNIGGAERMRIRTDGSVGIGTTFPQGTLEVVGGTFINGPLYVLTGQPKTAVGGRQVMIATNESDFPVQGIMTLYSNPDATQRRLGFGCVEQGVAWKNITFCESGGRVGIATPNPSGMLDIYTNDSTSAFLLHSSVDPNVSLNITTYGGAKYVAAALGAGCLDDLILYNPGDGSNVGFGVRNTGGSFGRTKIFHNGTLGGINSDAGCLTLNALNSLPVGICTTVPFSRLSMGATANSTNRLALYETAGGLGCRGIGMVNPSSGVWGVGIWADTGNNPPTDTNCHFIVRDLGRVGAGVLLPIAKMHIAGPGQSATTFETVSPPSGYFGEMLYAQDTAGVAGSGGGVLFGWSNGSFAAIKSYVYDGSGNSSGALRFYTRAAGTDSFLTARFSIEPTAVQVLGNITVANGSINVTGGQYLLNGVPLATGGAQTPWATDIDAAGHALTGCPYITGTPASGNTPVFKFATTAAIPTNMPNGTIAFLINEGLNTLYFRIIYNNGVVKQGQLSLT